MNLPFTTQQFLDTFGKYNSAVFPLQLIAVLLAVVMIVAVLRRSNRADAIILYSLAALWLWMGVVYHIAYFAEINRAAYAFGALFVVQGLLFGYVGSRRRIHFSYGTDRDHTVGSLLVVYALVVYPLLGLSFGHGYPNGPSFGVPCPTSIFTFGILLWSRSLPRYLLIIPAVWSVIGFSAALTLGIYEDVGLLLAGLSATVLLVSRKRTESPNVVVG